MGATVWGSSDGSEGKKRNITAGAAKLKVEFVTHLSKTGLKFSKYPKHLVKNDQSLKLLYTNFTLD